MAEDVKVPKLGKVNKKVLIPIVVAAGGYIGYRYWKARNDVGAGDAAVDPGMEDPGTLPGVAGAVRPDNSYGDSSGTGSGSTATGGFRGTTNSEWTEYVSDRLQQDGRWSYSVIAVALGNFLNQKPASQEQQDIIAAALGIAGYPPVGGHTIIPGGNTSITVAPTGVVGAATSPSTISVSFPAVAGAATYNGYLNSGASASATGAGAPLVFSGLTPGKSYVIQVAAVAPGGGVGPKSSTITVKTPAVAVGTPSKPVVKSVTPTRASLSTSAVPYATGYRWFVAGKIYNTTDGPALGMTNLHKGTRYSVSVQADTSTGAPGKLSAATTFTAK
jgi:hypothetical protein